MKSTNGLNFFVNISSIKLWGKKELFSKLQGLENQSFGGKPHQIGGKIGGFGIFWPTDVSKLNVCAKFEANLVKITTARPLIHMCIYILIYILG